MTDKRQTVIAMTIAMMFIFAFVLTTLLMWLGSENGWQGMARTTREDAESVPVVIHVSLESNFHEPMAAEMTTAISLSEPIDMLLGSCTTYDAPIQVSIRTAHIGG